jgi:hypothetical protein
MKRRMDDSYRRDARVLFLMRVGRSMEPVSELDGIRV